MRALQHLGHLGFSLCLTATLGCGADLTGDVTGDAFSDEDPGTVSQGVEYGGCSQTQIEEAQAVCARVCVGAQGSRGVVSCRPLAGSNGNYEAPCACKKGPALPVEFRSDGHAVGDVGSGSCIYTQSVPDARCAKQWWTAGAGGLGPIEKTLLLYAVSSTPPSALAPFTEATPGATLVSNAVYADNRASIESNIQQRMKKGQDGRHPLDFGGLGFFFAPVYSNPELVATLGYGDRRIVVQDIVMVPEDAPHPELPLRRYTYTVKMYDGYVGGRVPSGLASDFEAFDNDAAAASAMKAVVQGFWVQITRRGDSYTTTD